jgi:hypothetical protein
MTKKKKKKKKKKEEEEEEEEEKKKTNEKKKKEEEKELEKLTGTLRKISDKWGILFTIHGYGHKINHIVKALRNYMYF